MKKQNGMLSTKRGKHDASKKARQDKFRAVRKNSRLKKG